MQLLQLICLGASRILLERPFRLNFPMSAAECGAGLWTRGRVLLWQLGMIYSAYAFLCDI